MMPFFKKMLLYLVGALALFGAPGLAQSAPDPAGVWHGALVIPTGV
jgi:hypothetical protein